MFVRVIAAWLALLALTPFTAPFATCDLETLLAAHAPEDTHRTPSSLSIADASLPQAALRFSPSGRVRFIALSESRTAIAGHPLPTLAFARSARPLTVISQRVAVSNLRI
jgi:hypothetical protein